MCVTLLIATLWAYRLPRRNRESEMVVFGDGGGFVRLYEVRINPLVRVAPVLVPSAARLPGGLTRGLIRVQRLCQSWFHSLTFPWAGG